MVVVVFMGQVRCRSDVRAVLDEAVSHTQEELDDDGCTGDYVEEVRRMACAMSYDEGLARAKGGTMDDDLLSQLSQTRGKLRALLQRDFAQPADVLPRPGQRRRHAGRGNAFIGAGPGAATASDAGSEAQTQLTERTAASGNTSNPRDSFCGRRQQRQAEPAEPAWWGSSGGGARAAARSERGPPGS